jgi:tRNA A-37 threonylcarbamoyl transferase component Bud32
MDDKNIKEYFLIHALAGEVFAVERAEGGIHNDVYLVKTDKGEFVYKKHLDVSRTFPDIALPRGRYENEKNAYALLGRILNFRMNPEIIYLDDKNKIMVMESMGEESRADKNIVKIDPGIFFKIGKMLAGIVNKTYEDGNIRQTFNNAEFQELKYEYRYYKFIDNKKLFKARDELMAAARTNRHAFMHGDPRLNNIFIKGNDFYFIDYEGAYFADVSLDCAYLLSEIFIIYLNDPMENYRKMAENLWKGFLDELKVPVSAAQLKRNIIQHLGFALLDKVKGIIKNDYSFIINPGRIIKISEEIILNEKIDGLDKTFKI